MKRQTQFQSENILMSVLGHLVLVAVMIVSFSVVVERAKLVTPNRIQIVEIDLKNEEENSILFKNNKANSKIPRIKYIITLDSDTDLVLNSGLELIGAMSHILNRPELDENKNVVIDGHALMQPRVGVRTIRG